MPRLFVAPTSIQAGRVWVSGPDAHHLTRVLRLGPGDAVTVLDGTGWVYAGSLASVEAAGMSIELGERQRAAEPPVPITLVQALPKTDKLEWVIQKATELGASRIVALPAARSVAQVKGDRAEAKLARWQKIAQEAAEQSECGRVPVVELATSIAGLCWPVGTLVLVLSERSRGLTLPAALPAQAPAAGIAVWVGPEGGWTPEELEALVARGALEVGLGSRILRTETAGLAALAILLGTYELAGAAGPSEAPPALG